MGVIIDDREHRIIAEYPSLNRELQVKHLESADIVITNQEGAYVCFIERKAFSDFCTSLSDGRFREQRERMKAIRETTEGVSIVYILEGFPLWQRECELKETTLKDMARTLELCHMDLPRLQGALENLVFLHQIPIFPTKDVSDTVKTVMKLDEKLKESKGGWLSSSRPLPAKKVTTMKHLFASQLAMIPGISNTVGTQVASLYPDPRALVLAVEVDRAQVISTLAAICPKSRKLGVKAASLIVSTMCPSV